MIDMYHEHDVDIFWTRYTKYDERNSWFEYKIRDDKNPLWSCETLYKKQTYIGVS